MITFKILKKLHLTLLDEHSSNDYIFYPGDPVQIVVDNNTVFIKDSDGKLWESSNTISVINECLDFGILEKIND